VVRQSGYRVRRIAGGIVIQRTPEIIRSLVAIVAGSATFALTGAIRVQLQDSLSPEPWLAIILTVLTYVIPGAVVGIIVLRRSFVLGAALGALTLPVVMVLFGADELRFVPLGMWYQPMLIWLVLGIVLCPLGSLFGAWLRGLQARGT